MENKRSGETNLSAHTEVKTYVSADEGPKSAEIHPHPVPLSSPDASSFSGCFPVVASLQALTSFKFSSFVHDFHSSSLLSNSSLTVLSSTVNLNSPTGGCSQALAAGGVAVSGSLYAVRTVHTGTDKCAAPPARLARNYEQLPPPLSLSRARAPSPPSARVLVIFLSRALAKGAFRSSTSRGARWGTVAGGERMRTRVF